MYLYLSWKDSIETHPFNQANDFIVDLPKTLRLEGSWEVALTDVKIKSTKKASFYLLVDFCEENFLGGSQYPVLRRVDEKSTNYPFPYFVKTTKSELQSIRVSLLDQSLKPFQLSDIDCVLNLRRKNEGPKGLQALEAY